MAGPTCAVELEAAPDGSMLDLIDEFVKRSLTGVRETRKGRHWTGFRDGRPITVHVCDADEEAPASVWFSAGSNSADDYVDLRRLSIGLAKIVGGRATEPTK
jgi:hypothetical protein